MVNSSDLGAHGTMTYETWVAGVVTKAVINAKSEWDKYGPFPHRHETPSSDIEPTITCTTTCQAPNWHRSRE